MDRSAFPALFSQHARLLELLTALPEAALLVERFSGREAVCEPFNFTIDCIATASTFALKSLVGEEVTLRLRQADDSRRSWHGYVTEAAHLGSDGGLTRYRLRIEPWLSFLGQRRDSRVFQDLDLQGICASLFADYAAAAWRWEVTEPLRQRSLCIQYGESDLDFVRRLFAEEGLSFRFEHDQGARAGDAAAQARHRLVVFDRATRLPANAQPSVRFHRADAPEASDTIQVFSETRRLLPNVVTLASWDYKQLSATAAAAASALDNGELPALEVYDGSGAYRFETADAARLRTELCLAAYEAGYRTFSGAGSVRRLNEGTTFTLQQHDDYQGEQADFLVLAVAHEGANNLAARAAPLATATGIEAGTYRNRFEAQSAHLPCVPLPRPRPSAGPQTALVVGLADAPLSTERDHRVKIQFHWQRGARPNRGGLADTGPAANPGNAPGDERAGTWVRVAEWLAGPDWGGQFLPRPGTEVLVDFVDGDIDRPLVVGQLYNGADLPPFSAGADSDANHPGVLSGWTSHNHAEGYNQWVLDDAPGQLRTRLATSYAASQLGLGHLVEHEPRSAHRGAWRGAGFELRSDAWVAVRAGEGLLLSATARPGAVSTQLDAAEAVGQLRAAERTAAALSDAASAQGARPLEANPQQAAFIDLIDPARQGRHDGNVGGQAARKARPGSRDPGAPAERFAAPVMLNEAPGDIGSSSPASSVLHAGRNLHATVQQDWHTASAHTFSSTVGEGARWFTHAGGIKAVAAAGELSVQAHTDQLEVLADRSVTVTSTADEIHVLAKERIVLQAGRCTVTLQGADITFACPGTFSVKGSGNAFVGPGRTSLPLGALPDGRAKLFDEGFVLVDDATGEPLAGLPYRMRRAGGEWEYGTTDQHGRTHIDLGTETDALEIEIDA